MADCPEVLNKPSLKVEVQEIIAKYNEENQEETTEETQSPDAKGGAKSEGAYALPQSPGATGAESQGACALPQSPGATGGAESQGACALPQSPDAKGGAESQGACALPQSPGATGGAESEGACTLPQSPWATGGAENQGACALPQSPWATGGAESQGACALPQSSGATGGAESEGACALPQSPGATSGGESQEACALPPIQNISLIEKSSIISGLDSRIQTKGGDGVKESQPMSQEAVVHAPMTREDERKESGSKKGSSYSEDDIEVEVPNMPPPQPQQLPLLQNGATEVLYMRCDVEKTNNTALPKLHDHNNDDARLLGNSSDTSTVQSPDSDLSSGFDDSYPTE